MAYQYSETRKQILTPELVIHDMQDSGSFSKIAAPFMIIIPPIGALFALVLACVLGLLFHTLRRGEGARPFPFGPSIAVAAAVMLLYGEPLVAWYRGLLM